MLKCAEFRDKLANFGPGPELVGRTPTPESPAPQYP